MGLFTKNIGPVFIKETSDTVDFIEKMKVLWSSAGGNTKREIEKQIKLAQYGEIGERNVAFELKNSGMDMYILHDIYLEAGELSAQIDYIVITRKCVYVIECKNLIGNIEIDNGGNFIRTYELFGKRIKEGIYSPITQNQRHLQVIKEIRKKHKSNFLTKMMFEKNFDQNYKSVIVLANPKTYLNAKFAEKEVKKQVIRADQLIGYIRKLDGEMKEQSMSEDEMFKLAQFFLEKNNPERADYVKKYEAVIAEIQNAKEKEMENDEEKGNWQTSMEGTVRRLKTFRLEQSRKENIKPYYIFNDAQMRDLVEKKPRDKEELLKVSGFGNVKVEKYGEELLKILTCPEK